MSLNRVMPDDRRALRAEAEGRLARMRQGKRVFRDAQWPGDPDLKVKLAVLSCTEVQECHAQAVHRLQKELGLEPGATINLPHLQDETLTQILARACRDAEDPSKPLASDPSDLRDSSTVDERFAMYDAYVQFQNEIDPAPETMSVELRQEIEALVKKKDRAGLRSCGFNTLLSFMLSTDAPPSI